VRKVRIAGGAAGVVLAGLGMAWLPAAAQDGGPGPRMTFGVDQVFDVNDNLDLDVDSLGTSVQSITELSFGLVSETDISSLVFGAATGIRILNGPDSDNTVELDLDNTDITLGYDRAVANSALEINGVYTMGQIDELQTLGDFNTGAVVPEDLGQLNGTGQRRFYALNGGLTFGLQDRVGYELTAGFNGLDYANTTDPGLTGNNRAELGAALLLELSEVDQGRIGLTWGDFNSFDPEVEDSTNLNLDLGVTRDLPNGTVGFVVFADDYSVNDDSRAGFSLSRALELPEGALAASIGATQLEGADPELTGDLSWQQNLAESAFNLGVTRDVQNNADNVPQYVTGLSFDYSRELSPLSQLGVGIGYALIEDTASSDQTQTASLTAVYSRDLTEDWALDLGYTYRQREEDNDGMARSNSVFLGLRRAWELRP
jgi:hypothetical protein